MAENPRWPKIQDGRKSKMAENPRWPKIQDGHQYFKIFSLGTSVTPTMFKYQVW